MKRLLSLFLAVALVLAMIPAAAATDPGWQLDGNWSYDASTGVLKQNSAGGAFNTWNQIISGGYELSYTVNFSDVADEISRASGYLREWNGSTWQFLHFELQRNAQHTQVYGVIHFSSDGGASWGQNLQTTDWTDTSLSSLRVTFRMPEGSDTMQWIFSDPDTGDVLRSQSIAISNFSDAFNTGNKEFLLYAEGNSGLISYQDVELKAAGKEDGGEKTPVTFGSDVGWNNADVQPDNTKSYELGFDVDLTSIASCTVNDSWPDTLQTVIRNGVSDDYFKLEVQTYRNGSGQYQIATSAQYWKAGSWSDRLFLWSNNSETPITKVHVVLNYNAETAVYSWVITNRDNGAILSQSEYTETMPDALKACTACELKTFAMSYNDATANAPTNAYIQYGTTGSGETEIEYDPTKTPADFGWQTDNGNYQNWQITSDGNVLHINYDGENSKRVWKEIIQDTENFCVMMDVKVENWRCEIEVMGVHIELNCQGGNGNQIFSTALWDWFDASQQSCEVTVARAGGGDLTVKLAGKGNATPAVYTVTPVNTADKNVYIGTIDATNEATFSNVRDEGISGQNPGDFGWDTDEIDGTKDFSGWTTVDGLNISANNAQMSGNHRIWKNLISDQENFAVKTAVAMTADSSAYLKVLGQTLELDTRGGSGSQIGVKLNGSFIEWIEAEELTAWVYLIRSGSDISVSIVGSERVGSYTLTPSEESDNLELGLYAGNAEFRNIRAGKASTCRRQVPFGTVAFSGDFAGAEKLCKDISEYQDHTVVTVEGTEADLVIVTPTVEDCLSAQTVEDFLTAMETKLIACEGDVVVLTSLPYLAEVADVEVYAACNAGLRALAEKHDCLFADLYVAMGERAWTLESDGMTLSAVGETVAAGEVLEQLMRSCTCLAVNSVTPIKTTYTAAPEKTEAALAAFKAANDESAVRAAIEDEALGLNLRLYRSLSSENQTKVCQALAAADKNVADFAAADALFLAETMKVSRANPRTDMTREITTYVSVGDSITEGAQAVDRTTDCYAARFAAMLKEFLPLTFINKGISGTRMCTRTDNDMFPPASETVDEYIVAYQPDLLTVAYGINDYHAGTSRETFLSTYRAYLNEIKTKLPDTVVMVFSITAKGNDADAADIISWNAGIKALAEEFGYIYVDTYYDMRGVEWLLDDGLHPTNAGYRVIANAAMRTFNEYVCLEEPAPVETHSPDEFGWETDEIGGVKDFSGWAAEDAANISAEYNATTGEHRIWKNLLTNQNDFTAELDIITDNTSSAYVKVLGVTLELDSSGGDGNQSFVKLNGQNQDWVRGDNCEMHVKLERKDGGDLTITVTGKNGDTMDLTTKPTEENENLELGLYRGIASYKNITVTCEAVTPATYLVTFVDGLTGETIATDAVEEGNAATAPEAPAHEGYTFKGWDKDFSNVTTDLTVTAQYEKNEEPPKPTEYTVTFVDGLTNETISTVKVEEGKAATAPEAPAHEGYTFKGWDKDFSNVTADLTVTAQYEKNEEPPKPTEYTVTFVDGLTNETISTVKVEEGKAATAPEAPAHEGYTFKGWDKDFSNVTADLTVTALYEKNEEPPKPAEYTVTFIDGLTNETITTVKVEEGKAATAPEAPAHEGYTFKGWDKDFSNVTADLTVTALYEKNEEPPKPWVNPFKDVKESDWYYEGVKFAAQNELFNGTSPTTFEPDGDMTRAMLVTVLWRLDGKPAPKSMNSFKDVPSGQWYTEAVAWASENGVVDGVGNNLFEPDGNVTREQIAAIMYRYAGKKGYDTAKRADLSKYPDEGQVSSYAKEALSWANAEGLINGTNNGKGDALDPKGSATRAQVATILMRYVENIVE